MRIVVLIDPETLLPEDPQFEQGNDESRLEVEFHVTETLRELGHETFVAPFLPDVPETIGELLRIKPDLVFNLTEHHRGNRAMDKHIAAALELLRLPYTGAGPIGLMLCRDKGMTKRLLSHHRIRVPDFTTVPLGRPMPKKKIEFPVIVKPGFEDGSDGIANASIVRNDAELAERIRMLHERMNQTVICEEYIAGREIYVGMTGNQRITVYPAREVRFGPDNTGPEIATSRVKLDEAYRTKWGIEFTHAELPPELERKAAHIGKRVYRILQLRDYGRIDIRITEDGKLVVLEANPNPDLAMGDEVAEAAEKAGVSYRQLIKRIVSLARQRAGDAARWM